MKKIISIILMTVLLVSVAIMPAFAQEASNIDAPLQEVLDKVDSDCNIKVVVSVTDYLDEIEKVKIKVQTDAECGYTKDKAETREEQSYWLNTQTRLTNEFYEKANQSVVDQMNFSDDELLDYFQYYYTLFTTKERILEISAIEGVQKIYLRCGFVSVDPEHLFEEELYRKVNIVSDIYEYDEVEYHYNADGELEWVLINTTFDYPQPLIVYAVIGDRVWVGDSRAPSVGYYVYDVARESFIDICSSKISWDDYDGLEEAIYKQNIGRPIGDIDRDGKLTILDATKIQCALAGLEEFDVYDELSDYVSSYGYLEYISDANMDGNRDILDATTIQLKLAKVEA
ncbi:MAG: hypothetical protein IJ433_02755 [Ruminococcus sp.]|nr:hypothetical protein [Ruminococcus sp.]